MDIEEIKDVVIKIVDEGEWSYVYIGGIRSRKLETLYNEGKIDSEDIRRLLSIFIGDVKIVIFRDPETDGGITLFVAGDDPALKTDQA